MSKVFSKLFEKINTKQRNCFEHTQEEFMKAATTNTMTNEVLFQKLGNTWYVFTEINSEMVYSALPTGMDPRTTKLELYDVIEEHMKKVAKFSKRNSEVSAA